MTRHAPRITLTVALFATLIAGCADNSRPTTPAGGTEPSTFPSARLSKGICMITAPRSSVQQPSQLPKTASSADLFWYPGMNAKGCRTYRTSLDAAQADRLLNDLRAAKGPIPGAAYSCPMDDGSFVEAWFHTPSASPSFTIDLTGCAWYRPNNAADLGKWPYTPYL